MYVQGTFAFGAPRHPDPVYFALRPDADSASAMVALAMCCARRHGLSGNPYTPRRLHVSLHPVMSRRGLRKDDAAAALRAAERVRAAPFPMMFDRIATFQGRKKRPVVLCGVAGIGPLAALRETLRREMLKEGLWPGPVRFEPHVTLLWDERRVPGTILDEPIGWTARDFTLVRSFYGQRRQVDLGTWPLDLPTPPTAGDRRA